MSCKLYKGNLIDMMSIGLIFIKNWNYDLIVDDLGVNFYVRSYEYWEDKILILKLFINKGLNIKI